MTNNDSFLISFKIIDLAKFEVSCQLLFYHGVLWGQSVFGGRDFFFALLLVKFSQQTFSVVIVGKAQMLPII